MKLGNLLSVGLILALGACDDPSTGSKRSYYDDYWIQESKDTFLDGSVRTSAWTSKEGRELKLRCFRFMPDSPTGSFDLRYVIDVPLLARVLPEIEKAGPVQLVLSIDGLSIGSVDVRPLAHDFGISFLGNVSGEMLDKIAAAKTSVIAMPRQGSDKLDEVIEFGVGDLAKTIEPVKRACKPLSLLQPPADVPTTKT
ncbi:MAG: hypothetical protein JSR78_09885 [Proteobacteria bacterium]|nr:hypothetical protein [Pseudomonadota bacterium]